MAVTSFSDSGTLCVPAVPFELVRGTESGFVESILPCVRRESVTLDFSAVERIDAAGIAALITLYCAAADAGTTFFVTAPSSHVLELLQLVGLDSILVRQYCEAA